MFSFHFKNTVDILQIDELRFDMDIVKLDYSKYALAVEVAGKHCLISADGELLSFESKRKAEEVKMRIQKNIHLIEVVISETRPKSTRLEAVLKA